MAPQKVMVCTGDGQNAAYSVSSAAPWLARCSASRASFTSELRAGVWTTHAVASGPHSHGQNGDPPLAPNPLLSLSNTPPGDHAQLRTKRPTTSNHQNCRLTISFLAMSNTMSSASVRATWTIKAGRAGQQD